jgi:uncharacterized protein (TIGR03086 family)
MNSARQFRRSGKGSGRFDLRRQTTMTDTAMQDLTPATQALARVLAGIDDAHLGLATPCRDTTVAQLLAHVDTLSVAFARAAAKEPEQRPDPMADAVLADGWGARIPQQLAAMADAWADPTAWSGQTWIGGTDQPGELCGLIGLDEVVVHGWDLAVATGQTYTVDDGAALAAAAFAGPLAAQAPEGIPGLFGPSVVVPPNASALDRLLGLTGRNPGWRPS